MSTSAQQGSETGPGRSAQWLHKLWVGGGKPAIYWRPLIGGILVLLLSNLVLTVGLTAIRWPESLKLVGVVCVLLTLGCIFLGVKALIRVAVQLGLKRLLVLLTVLFFFAVILVGSVVETDRQGASHWFASAGIVTRWVIGGVGNLGQAIVQAPDTIRFAATGRREPIKVSGGVDWVGGVPLTPIVVPAPSENEINIPVPPKPDSQVEQPGPSSESSSRIWQVGDSVRVVTTGEDRLLAHVAPATNAKITAHFSKNSILTITDGPQTVDGRVWWKVRGETDEGWCVANYLTSTETP